MKQSKEHRITKGFNNRHKATTFQCIHRLDDKIRGKRRVAKSSKIDEELATIVLDIGFSKSRNTKYSFWICIGILGNFLIVIWTLLRNVAL
jgi:hypothetical protein